MLTDVLPFIYPVLALCMLVGLALAFVRRRHGRTRVRVPLGEVTRVDEPRAPRLTDGTAVDDTVLNRSTIDSTEDAKLHVSNTRMKRSGITVRRVSEPDR